MDRNSYDTELRRVAEVSPIQLHSKVMDGHEYQAQRAPKVEARFLFCLGSYFACVHDCGWMVVNVNDSGRKTLHALCVIQLPTY